MHHWYFNRNRIESIDALGSTDVVKCQFPLFISTGMFPSIYIFNFFLQCLIIFWVQVYCLLGGIYFYIFYVVCCNFKDVFVWFLERGGGKEKERERNIHVWEKHGSGTFHTPPTGDQAHNPDTHTDRASNWWCPTNWATRVRAVWCDFKWDCFLSFIFW